MPDVVDRKHAIGALGRPQDRAIAALAARQHGVVAYRQLAELGLGRGAVRGRLEASRLHRLYRGVYAVGHDRLTARGRWMSAVLACGPQALLSHRDAAALLGLRASARRLIDVTVPGRSRSGHPGVDLHLVRRLHPDDCTIFDGIPATSIARTLLDLGEVPRWSSLERAFEEAERLRLLDMAALERLHQRSHGRRGLRALKALLAQRPAAPPTRSELERDFLDLCDLAELPRPPVNVRVCGYEVDACWRDRRLVVELDGFEFHRTRAAFERDRKRDSALQLAGFRVLRLTHRRMAGNPADTARLLRAMYFVTQPAGTA